MKRIVFACLMFLAMQIALIDKAAAHVLVQDTTKSKGAILHIMPDDDPTAGRPAQLFFDMQGTVDDSFEVTLNISSDNETVTVPVQRDGSLMTAEYIFPSGGQYQIRYEIATSGRLYTFEHSTQITRGESEDVLRAERHMWAEVVLLCSLIAFAVLCICWFNRRHEIAKQSTF